MDLPQSVSVRIGPAASASGTYRNTSEKLWSALGFTLPALLTEVWGKQESRMDIDPAVDVRRLVQALCDDLGIAASRERRSVEMLVVRPR